MDIDTVYANVISIVFFLLLYYPIMPVIFLFVTFTFVLLYWTSKIAFIKSSRKPNVINHNPNRICFRLILLGLIINCFLTPLFFSTISDDKDAPKDYFTVLH